ncbi:MAG: hypothetical protein JNK25_01450 [Phycisphaerae bacterium]|nr:hypothetical protein [Phycisphaerae bacterium]
MNPVPLACLAIFSLPVCAAWPPDLSTHVQCGDVVGYATFTVTGVWNDSCVPTGLRAERRNDGTVLLTVLHEFTNIPICLPVLRPYSVRTDLILPDGEYPVLVALDSTVVPDRDPVRIGEVLVRCLPRCIADFNHDGGVDGSDVEAFFIAWESADPEADVNFDGGVDGADVQTFFELWQTGGC